MADDLIPVRMLNEWVYCPRLFSMMHVEGLMEANADVWKGRYRHAGRDAPSERVSRRKAPEGAEADDEAVAAPELPEPWREATALTISSVALGLVGKLDTVLLSPDGRAVPVELKKGKAPTPAQSGWCRGGLWRTDAIQLGAQALLLREQGYEVPRVEAYYAASRALVVEPFDEAFASEVRDAVAGARACQAAGALPSPLVDSPKCERCSLNEVCLPEESALLASGAAGYLDDPDTAEPAVRRVIPATVESSILVVEAVGATVRRRGEALAVEVPRELAEREGIARETQVPFDNLHEVCLVGPVQVTAQAMLELMARGVPVSYLARSGRLVGMVLGGLGNNVRLRIAQHRLAADPAQRLRVARAIVSAKIRNQRTLIRRNDREVPERVLAELASLAEAAGAGAGVEGVEEVMGQEGRAARLYFERFAALVADRSGGALEMDGRSRRPPRDPVNAMLSFGYAVLAKDLQAVAHRVGFDPMVGFLHSPGFGRPALALDLMEELRPLVVDSVVLRMVAQGQVDAGDFVVRPGEVIMRSAARRGLLRSLEQRKKELVTHPVFGYRVSYHRTMDVQARLLARYCLGEAPEYLPFTTR